MKAYSLPFSSHNVKELDKVFFVYFGKECDESAVEIGRHVEDKYSKQRRKIFNQ